MVKYLSPRDENFLSLPMQSSMQAATAFDAHGRDHNMGLLVANVTICRLLNDLRAVETSLKFWSSRLVKHDKQANAYFLFLSQGPTHFFSQLLAHAHKILTYIKLRIKGTSQINAVQVLRTSMVEAQQEILRKEMHLKAIKTCLARALIRVHRSHEDNCDAPASSIDEIMAELIDDVRPELPAATTPGGGKILHRVTSMGGKCSVVEAYAQLKAECKSALDRFFLCPTAALRALKNDLKTGHLPPLISLPPSLAAPSMRQQRWLIEVAKGISFLSALRFLYKHSWLGGSSDLEDWIKQAVTATRSAVQDHVVEPLDNLQAELCRTFRDRPGLVSQAEYESDKEALRRMLKAFERDWTIKTPPGDAMATIGSSADGDEALLNGMKLVMDRYESELRQPLRNLLLGDLARAMLIQVQRLKIDTESAMLKLDQILKASEFSITLMAAFPALIVVWLALSSAIRFLIPSQPDFNRDAVAFRCSIAEFNRSLHSMRGSVNDEAAEGMVLYHLSRVSRELERLYVRYDRDSKRSEYPGLSAFVNDLVSMASKSFTAEDMEKVVDRMRVSYRAMQH